VKDIVDLSVMTLRLWEELGEVAPFAVIATDVEGKVRVWSPGAQLLYGWAVEETIGRPIQDLTVGPVDRRVAQEIMEQVVRGEIWEGTFHARNRKGEVVEVFVVDLPICDIEGRPCGIVGVSFRLDSDRFQEPVENLLSLARQIRESRLRDRTRIARVLHDDIGQMLATVRTDCLSLAEGIGSESLMNVAGHLDIAITQLRQQVAFLMESPIDVWEMILRCYEMTRELRSRVDLLADCRIIGSLNDFQCVDVETASTAYSMVRESLRNVERHSGAQHVEVCVSAQAGALTVTVVDDGKGMDDSQFGMGLSILRESAEQLHGQLDVRAVREGDLTGTSVNLRMPIAKALGG